MNCQRLEYKNTSFAEGPFRSNFEFHLSCFLYRACMGSFQWILRSRLRSRLNPCCPPVCFFPRIIPCPPSKGSFCLLYLTYASMFWSCGKNSICYDGYMGQRRAKKSLNLQLPISLEKEQLSSLRRPNTNSNATEIEL